MATPSNKPRDIKNLKARLGRTITPGQVGAPSAPPGASVPPPALGSGLTPPVGSVPPPMMPPGSSPGSLPSPGFPGGIAAPPFAARPAASQRPAGPVARPSAPPGAIAPAAAPRVDPFGASTAAVPTTKKVTLVIDDSAVKADEIGRKSRGRAFMLVGVGALVGLAMGFGVGSTTDKRHQYSMAVRDGKEIYAKVQTVSKEIDKAKDLVKRAVEASSGGPGKKATIDFQSIEALVAMERPFSANEFHRRLYRAFGDGVVDALFDYYNNVNLLWDGFTNLGAKTAGQARRDALLKSATAADGLLNTEYGMVFSKNGEMLNGALVFVTIPQQDAAPAEKKEKGKEKEAPKLKVASTQGGQEVERTLYMGQDGMAEEYEKYVVMLDKVRSRNILGESANLFGKFRADLMDIHGRMEKTAEVQGRLLKDLGQVAALSE